MSGIFSNETIPRYNELGFKSKLYLNTVRTSAVTVPTSLVVACASMGETSGAVFESSVSALGLSVVIGGAALFGYINSSHNDFAKTNQEKKGV